MGFKNKNKNNKRKESYVEEIYKDLIHFSKTNDHMAIRYYRNKYFVIRIITRKKKYELSYL